MSTVTARVTTLSWLPSELMHGPMRLPFDVGLTHYDVPPPDVLTDLASLGRAGRFRFCNRLSAEAHVTDGRITHARALPDSGGIMGRTNVLGGAVRFPAIPRRDLVTSHVSADGASAVVRQTSGGRAALPALRRVHGRPHLVSPLVWTTLEVELHADGTSRHRVVGASAFPRHWVYDADGRLVQKVAVADADSWFHSMQPAENPWAGSEHAVLTSEAETELERRLSSMVMSGERRVRQLPAGSVLFRQGDLGSQVALLLDGMVEVECDGVHVAEIGPGAVIGERALLEGARTSTVVAVTDITVALVDATTLPRSALEELVDGHRREEATPVVAASQEASGKGRE